MPVHLHREIDKLKKKILAMSVQVLEAIAQAVKSLNSRDLQLAEKIMQADDELDQMELDIEEDCLKILALYNPVAQDLRFVVAVLKINNDLERMADQAANIAERARFLALHENVNIPSDLSDLASIVQKMLENTLTALMQRDKEMAWEVIRTDDQADAIHRKMYELVQENMRRYPDQIECQINIISVSRNLERIADQITNIAEDIIYMVEGRLVRHSGL